MEHFSELAREQATEAPRRALLAPPPREGTYDIRPDVETYVPPTNPLTPEEQDERLRLFRESDLESRRKTKEEREGKAKASLVAAADIATSSSSRSASHTGRLPNWDQWRAFDEQDDRHLKELWYQDSDKVKAGEMTQEEATLAHQIRELQLQAKRLAREKQREESKGQGRGRHRASTVQTEVAPWERTPGANEDDQAQAFITRPQRKRFSAWVKPRRQREKLRPER